MVINNRSRKVSASRTDGPARQYRPGVLSCLLCSCAASLGQSCVEIGEGTWLRHTIDDTSRGADGARLADVNADGWPDIATPWEEGGRTRVCLNPGPALSRSRWPSVTVGKVGSPEDAVFVDLDGDGAVDVVSSCEGSTETVYVHWAPGDGSSYLVSASWVTEPIPATQDARKWMFCEPVQVDGQHGIDLVVGAKGDKGQVGWLESPANPRDLAAWSYHTITDAGWIMSIIAADMDGDDDPDLVVSDRKGSRRGSYWLENPGAGPAQESPWPRHNIGGEDREVMFLTLADLDGDGRTDVLATTQGKEILYHHREDDAGLTWTTSSITIPELAGTGKGIAVGDIDNDGQLDVVFSSENADQSGVLWISYRRSPTEPIWDAHDISGPEGVKYDLVELVDLDADGDLDVLTCEERTNLGVVWYENPTRR